MKRLFAALPVLAIALIILSWTTGSVKPSNANVIAVYNIDSILIQMPAYDSLVRVYERYQEEYAAQDSLIQLAYLAKAHELWRDSAKLSPLIYGLKKKELDEMTSGIRDYRRSLVIDLESAKDNMLSPSREKIKLAAGKHGKTNGFLAVVFTEGVASTRGLMFDFWDPTPYSAPVLVKQRPTNALVYFDGKIKTVNITKEIALQMGCKP
jgi:hypothetical protein